MCLFVGCQVARLSESPATVWKAAKVWFLTSMSSEVRPQIEVEREALATDATFERLLSSMD